MAMKPQPMQVHPSSLNGASQLLRARSFSKVHFAESKESKDRPVKPENERRRCHVMIPRDASATHLQPRRSHIYLLPVGNIHVYIYIYYINSKAINHKRHRLGTFTIWCALPLTSRGFLYIYIYINQTLFKYEPFGYLCTSGRPNPFMKPGRHQWGSWVLGIEKLPSRIFKNTRCVEERKFGTPLGKLNMEPKNMGFGKTYVPFQLGDFVGFKMLIFQGAAPNYFPFCRWGFNKITEEPRWAKPKSKPLSRHPLPSRPKGIPQRKIAGPIWGIIYPPGN